MSDSCGGAIEDSDDSRDRNQPYAPQMVNSDKKNVITNIQIPNMIGEESKSNNQRFIDNEEDIQSPDLRLQYQPKKLSTHSPSFNQQHTSGMA